MAQNKMRIGFDFDGVIMYNPARAIRRPLAFVKKLIIPHKKSEFFFPSKKISQLVNILFHKSSFKVATGYDTITQMVHADKIDPYIITARWSFLKKDFLRLIHSLNAQHIFQGYFLNEKNEQPHLFKERMIKELNLDVFIEDNLDIVDYLRKNTKAEILWISNFFDRHEHRDGKFPSLKKAVEYIQSKTDLS